MPRQSQTDRKSAQDRANKRDKQLAKTKIKQLAESAKAVNKVELDQMRARQLRVRQLRRAQEMMELQKKRSKTQLSSFEQELAVSAEEFRSMLDNKDFKIDSVSGHSSSSRSKSSARSQSAKDVEEDAEDELVKDALKAEHLVTENIEEIAKIERHKKETLESLDIATANMKDLVALQKAKTVELEAEQERDHQRLNVSAGD